MTSKPKLGELLVQAGVIDTAQLNAALGEQRQWGKPLGMTLVRMGMLDEDTLVQTLASQLKVPVVKLTGKTVNPEVLAQVPQELARKHRCLPLLLNDEGGQRVLYLGMEDPSDLEALDQIGFHVGGKVKPVLVAPGELEDAFALHAQWGASAPVATAAAGSESDIDDIQFGDEPFAVASESSPSSDATVAPVSDASTPSQTAMLRALGQLLVEKGIITRDEFVERVRAVMREDAGG